MEGNLNAMSRKGRVRIGLGLFALIFVGGLALSRTSSDQYIQSSRTALELRDQLDDVVTVRGRINGIFQVIADGGANFASPAQAIEQRVWNLQSLWSDLQDQPKARAVAMAPTREALDSAIDKMALSALRAARSIRRGDYTSARLQMAVDPSLENDVIAAVAGMEGWVGASLVKAETEKEDALMRMSYGRSITAGAFFSFFSLLIIGLVLPRLLNLDTQPEDQIQPGFTPAEVGAASQKLVSTNR